MNIPVNSIEWAYMVRCATAIEWMAKRGATIDGKTITNESADFLGEVMALRQESKSKADQPNE